MRKNDLIEQLNKIEGNQIVHIPTGNDPCSTVELTTVGISYIPDDKLNGIIILDFE